MAYSLACLPFNPRVLGSILSLADSRKQTDTGILVCVWLLVGKGNVTICHVEVVTSAVVGMFFPYRHVNIICSQRRHACRHSSCFKVELNTRRKTVKTKVSWETRVTHAYIISLL